MIERVVKSAKEGILNEFIPCPQDLLDTVSGFMGNGTPEQAALEAKQRSNVEKYGYTTWYEHNVNEWGTKWDITADTCERVDENTVHLSFDSAWSPPIGAYQKLEAMGFGVQAFYNEGGMAYCGIYEDGVDEYIEYGSAKSDTVREIVGERLDDYFAISENMAMWEEESAE
jgi:hypothetical protein